MTPSVPAPYRVVDRREETRDTVTLSLAPVRSPLAPFGAGQFAMVYAFGVGEIPLSVSAIEPDGRLSHTVRAVGAVSRALCGARVRDVVGLRGPFGTGWEPEAARDQDLVVVAGGIGLAPLAPLIRHAVRTPRAFGHVNVLIGARSPDDLVFPSEIGGWATTCTGVTVDHPTPSWRGEIGLVTRLLDNASFDPARTTACVCGPEPMIRATARDLAHRGVPPHRVRVSLERNMRCATAHCGHCQLGPVLLCRDGPVIGFDRAEPLMSVREL